MNHETPMMAQIQNTWSRPGMTTNSATGHGVVGRFVADSDCWKFESAVTGPSIEGTGDPLEALKSLLGDLRCHAPAAGAIGYVSYEWGSRALGLPSRRPAALDWSVPEIQFVIYERLTHPTAQRKLLPSTSRRTYTRAELDSLLERAETVTCVSKSRYLTDVGTIKEHIAAGDIYQANYTQALELTADSSVEETHDRLGASLFSPFSAFLRFDACSLDSFKTGRRAFPDIAIICVSPERFWRKRGRTLDSRPIKGTIARGLSLEDDRVMRRQLLESSKDRAELLMITDLVRNDLGQVADIGTVRTESLLRIRPTPSVWHLESTISAQLAPNLSWVEVMHALSPAGSITGTPKRRAVEILTSLEPVNRGPYCGAIGWVDANGDADFAVGIRTLVQSGSTIRIHGGGGIVADSDPNSEYYESLVKIAPLIDLLSAEPTSAITPAKGKYA